MRSYSIIPFMLKNVALHIYGDGRKETRDGGVRMQSREPVCQILELD